MTPMDDERSVAAVILAAGSSSRYGSPKPLIRVGARTLLQVAGDAATGARLSPIIAVVPPGVSVPETIQPIVNGTPEQGMSRSLRLGLDAVPPDAEAAVVLLVDQPTVDVALLGRLLGARGRTPVVATRGAGIVGPPVVLERDAFDLAAAADGDAGLRDVLRSEPSLVTAVELDDPPPDVDTPADLERLTEPCAGCRARYLPHRVDETHPYIGASAACWATFGELLAREFGDPAYGRVHRHSVDVYAVQHPGNDGRRQRQSVALHLIAICRWLEHGDSIERLNRDTRRLAADERDWPWLDPPERYPMMVVDVLEARDGAEHADLVRRWTEATWAAWSAHHDRVRTWAMMEAAAT